MPRGGARLNSGPAPDENALRRDRPSDKAGWTVLPASGREAEAPGWPLLPDVQLSGQLALAESNREMLEAQIDAEVASRGAAAKLAKLDQAIAELRIRLDYADGMELELWETLWHTPQAVVWESLRWTREVALYVRLQVSAELGDLDSGKEARQWSDRLGLNPTALLRNRWKIEGATTPAPAAKPSRSRSAKSRLQVLEGGKGGKASGDDGGSPRVG